AADKTQFFKGRNGHLSGGGLRREGSGDNLAPTLPLPPPPEAQSDRKKGCAQHRAVFHKLLHWTGDRFERPYDLPFGSDADEGFIFGKMSERITHEAIGSRRSREAGIQDLRCP